MRNVFLVFLLFLLPLNLICQKRNLTSNELGTWPLITYSSVSNDGHFVTYIMMDPKQGKRMMYVKNVVNNSVIGIQGGNRFKFSDDNNYGFFLKGKDSLCILNLKSSAIKVIGDVGTYSVFMKGDYLSLVYRLKKSNTLVVYNISRNKEIYFHNVIETKFPLNGSMMVMINSDTSDRSINKLLLFDFKAMDCLEIWKGWNVANIIFTNDGYQLFFTGISGNEDADSVKFWHYKFGENKPKEVLLKGSLSTYVRSRLKAISNLKLPGNGQQILFSIGDTIFQNKKKNVTVWRYSDRVFPSADGNTYKISEKIYGVNLNNCEVNLLVDSEERLISSYKENIGGEDLFEVVEKSFDNLYDSSLSRYLCYTYYLVDLKTGSRKILLNQVSSKLSFINFSPNMEWVLYYNPVDFNYYSYNVKKNKSVNLTNKLNTKWGQYNLSDLRFSDAHSVNTCLWYGSNVIINDQYNLWFINIEGKDLPKNLTLNINPLKNIIFSPTIESNGIVPLSEKYLIVTGFNLRNKNHSIYKLFFFDSSATVKLFEGPVLLGRSYQPYFPIVESESQNRKFFVVVKETGKDYPNLYLTNNFSDFIQVTFFNPEKEFNWLFKELHEWKRNDGIFAQAIMYKPEDFDTTKKYPVIIHFYDKMSDELNEFPIPDHPKGAINIPYLVANGYIVFTPDIYFKSGNPGESFLNSVLSATNYLSRFNYIDTAKIGLQGHSFAGYGVNYIISHSNRFSAAVSGSGTSNLVSHYVGFKMSYATDNMNQLESGQYRMGATLWESPSKYIDNSPLFKADHVSTPLLIMANRQDDGVSFFQGLGFYLSLRKFQKKCWLLEYDGEGHQLTKLIDQLDYEEKGIQFFDYFLKGKHPAEWLGM